MRFAFICWIALFYYYLLAFSSARRFKSYLYNCGREENYLRQEFRSFKSDFRSFCRKFTIDSKCNPFVRINIGTWPRSSRDALATKYVEQKRALSRDMDDRKEIAASNALDELVSRKQVPTASKFISMIIDTLQTMRNNAVGKSQLFLNNLNPDQDVRCGLFYYYFICVNKRPNALIVHITDETVNEFEKEVFMYAIDSMPIKSEYLIKAIMGHGVAFMRSIAQKEFEIGMRFTLADGIARRRALYYATIEIHAYALFKEFFPTPAALLVIPEEHFMYNQEYTRVFKVSP